jgi:hypothetical protein
MKRLGPRYELVCHRPLLLVGGQGTVLGRHLFPQFFEAGAHEVCGGSGVEIVDRHFVEFAGEEMSLDGACLGARQKARAWLDFEAAQSGLISREHNVNVQRMFGSPINQLFRRISPTQPKRRVEDGLSVCRQDRPNHRKGDHEEGVQVSGHGRDLGTRRVYRKARCARGGMVLLEATLALSLLTVLGLGLLKLSLGVLHPRQWTLQQVLTDAYLTYERAYAQRVPFETITSASSPWPIHPATTSTQVEVGRLPGGRPLIGTVIRTRMPDSGNYPVDGGTGTVVNNPAAMKIWRLQSVLTYQISGRNYAKSRTVVRSQ